MTAADAIARAHTHRAAKPDWSDPTARLHQRVRIALSGASFIAINAAIAEADRVFAGGAGHMQTALSAAIAVGRSYSEQGKAA